MRVENYRSRSNSRNKRLAVQSICAPLLSSRGMPALSGFSEFSCRAPVATIGLGILLIMMAACGCASREHPVPTTSSAAQTTSENSSPGPEARISISYSRPDDFLTALTVTEYVGADTILAESDKGANAQIIRFDGGVVIWDIGIKKKFLKVRLVGERKPRRITEIVYGKLPPDFIANVPDSGPPEPLQPDHYYIFAATRASGATSYEAVKVNGDGSLEAYAAEPRAGDSFRLCCDISADFVVNANTMTTPANQ